MGKDKQQKIDTDNQVIKATSDVFMAMLLSAQRGNLFRAVLPSQ